MPALDIPSVDGRFMLERTADLCRIPSPTGYTKAAIEEADKQLTALGLKTWKTVKGALVAAFPGSLDKQGGGRVLSAHVDTLGAMVKEIKPNGRLKLTKIGGYDWSTIEGEYCAIIKREGSSITGTILTTKASSHVHGQALIDLKRDEQSIEVRIDADVRSAEATRALGIEVGDFVALDSRTTITPAGFIKSRHLDDKACVAILIGVAKALKESATDLVRPTYFYISSFEEVGHGTSAGVPEGVTDIIAVDMAAVGEGQTSDEFAVTVCVKDGSGPYNYDLSSKLIDLAKSAGLDYRVDIYTYYSSDVSQALRAGYDIRGALVGPGVDASHSFERLHQRSLEETAKLLLAYLLSED
jgi:putative aminopeptidase FrvX